MRSITIKPHVVGGLAFLVLAACSLHNGWTQKAGRTSAVSTNIADFWRPAPSLSGSTPGGVTVDEGQQFYYSVTGFDKDTLSSEVFDSSLYEVHSISSMSSHSEALSGESVTNGTRTWTLSGRAWFVNGNTFFYDTFWFDDSPGIQGRDDPAAGPYTMTVLVKEKIAGPPPPSL